MFLLKWAVLGENCSFSRFNTVKRAKDITHHLLTRAMYHRLIGITRLGASDINKPNVQTSRSASEVGFRHAGMLLNPSLGIVSGKRVNIEYQM